MEKRPSAEQLVAMLRQAVGVQDLRGQGGITGFREIQFLVKEALLLIPAE